MIPGIVAQAVPGTAAPDLSEEAHRYWRVLFHNNYNSACALSRLEMRESAAGADVAPGNTLISSGSWTDVANLFDANDATFGYHLGPTRPSPATAGMDFGASSANWPVIREIVVRNRSDFAPQGPLGMAIQYSDDNSTWETAWCEIAAQWASTGEVQTFTKPTPRRKVVLDIQSPPTDAGPHAITLTATGNATVSGGRFVFDGNGDYYANTAVHREIYRLPWQFEIEINEVLATNGGLNAMVCIGGNSSRLIFVENNGAVQVWLNASASALLSASGIIDAVTPKDLRFVVNGTSITLFVDGVSTASGTLGSTLQTQDDLYLGNDPFDTAARCMNGGFSAVRMTFGNG